MPTEARQCKERDHSERSTNHQSEWRIVDTDVVNLERGHDPEVSPVHVRERRVVIRDVPDVAEGNGVQVGDDVAVDLDAERAVGVAQQVERAGGGEGPVAGRALEDNAFSLHSL